MDAVLDLCTNNGGAGYMGTLVVLFLVLNTLSLVLEKVAAKTVTKIDDKWAARLLRSTKFIKAIIDFLIAKR